jgi:hypothetical protein
MNPSDILIFISNETKDKIYVQFNKFRNKIICDLQFGENLIYFSSVVSESKKDAFNLAASDILLDLLQDIKFREKYKLIIKKLEIK